MKFTPLTLLLVAAAASLAPAQSPAPSATTPAGARSNEVIGRMGDFQVNADEVRASVASLNGQDGAAIGKDPALLKQVVRSLLVQRALLKEAGAKAHDKKPEVAAQLARAREVALTESYLQSVSAPPESYPNEAGLKTAYETAGPSIGVPKTWRLAQIFIAVSKEADKTTSGKAQARLETVRKALKAPSADFGKLATEHSDESIGAGRGGEIGWLAETQIQPEILESLKVDSTSEPIRLNDGWHFLKVLDSREPYTPTLDQIRSQLIARLRAEKTKANSEVFLTKLLQDNPLAIDEISLAKVLTK